VLIGVPLAEGDAGAKRAAALSLVLVFNSAVAVDTRYRLRPSGGTLTMNFLWTGISEDVVGVIRNPVSAKHPAPGPPYGFSRTRAARFRRFRTLEQMSLRRRPVVAW